MPSLLATTPPRSSLGTPATRAWPPVALLDNLYIIHNYLLVGCWIDQYEARTVHVAHSLTWFSERLQIVAADLIAFDAIHQSVERRAGAGKVQAHVPAEFIDPNGIGVQQRLDAIAFDFFLLFWGRQLRNEIVLGGNDHEGGAEDRIR